MKNRMLQLTCLLCCLQISWGQSIKMANPGSPTTVENFVSELAAHSASSGSLVVSGICADNKEVVAPLKHPPEGPFRNMGIALTALTQADRHLAWSRSQDGKFRVRDSRVSNDILGIYLRDFRFDNAAGIDVAIFQLINSPEVKAYYSKHSIENGFVYNPLGGLVPQDLPRLNAELPDMTLAAALDRIIIFYPGVWIYSECRNGPTRRVVISGSLVRWPRG